MAKPKRRGRMEMRHTSWLPRDTIKARVQCTDEFDLSHLVSGECSRPGWFATTLAAETRAVLARLAKDLRDLALPGLENVEVELDEDELGISGRASPGEDQPILTLSLGFALAVDEATLEFLSWEDALCPKQVLRDREAGEDHAAGVERYAYEEDHIGRYVTYRHLRDTHLRAEDVTSGFPANLWRLRQQQLLFELVMRWAALHEIAHGALCHLDLLQAFFGGEGPRLSVIEDAPLSGGDADGEAWKGFGFDEPPLPETREADIRQVLELHADTCASWLAYDLDRIARERGDGLFEAYARDMTALGADQAAHFIALSPDNRTHFLLLAGLIAVVMFEFSRRSSGREVSETHPLPEARLIAMIRESFYGSELARPDGEGGFRIVIPSGDLYPEAASSAWNRFIEDGPARAIEDMEFFSSVLEMDLALFGPEAEGAPDVPIAYYDDGYLKGVAGLDLGRTSRWWQDVIGRGELAAAALRGVVANVVPLSEGGKQLRGLDPYHPYINRISELLQVRAGGPALAFLLTQRGQAAEEDLDRSA